MGVVLIFDEIMTGFRLSKKGGSGVFGIESDLVTYGKVLGGGFPIGALGGKEEIMKTEGIFYGGTFSANPLSMYAAKLILKTIVDKKTDLKEKKEVKKVEVIKKKSSFIFPQKKPSIYKSKTDTAEKSSILNQKDFDRAKETIQFIKDKKWNSALKSAAKVKDREFRNLITWMHLKTTRNGASFAEYKKFIEQNEEYPRINRIRYLAEHKLSTDKISPKKIIDWFGANEPLSGFGKMILGESALDLTDWMSNIKQSQTKASRDLFFMHAKKLNLRNSIFVDNTASEIIAKEYARYLNNNIGVVTCNKIAAADELNNYLNLKNISRKFRSPYLFETNVGAGLPIIDTLNNLVASGDQIIKIQAVLSGSLNFVFNNFKKGVSFHDVVLQAQQEGYTEPDPKIDLSGVDVARKILILARESGMKIELGDIENESFLPQECLDTNNNKSFFKSLVKHSDHFEKMLEKSEKEGAKMKYVAQFENGKAKVGIQLVKEGHNFYNLEGSDNIILFYTNRYKNQPLIVKGAGAGADVTASGIFADIIRIGKQ